jgi:hypothetical protein
MIFIHSDAIQGFSSFVKLIREVRCEATRDGGEVKKLKSPSHDRESPLA